MTNDSEQERWTDEQLARELEDAVAASVGAIRVHPGQEVLREAARRLRGGDHNYRARLDPVMEGLAGLLAEVNDVAPDHAVKDDELVQEAMSTIQRLRVGEGERVEVLLRDYFDALDEYRNNITNPGREGSGFAEASKRVTSLEDELRGVVGKEVRPDAAPDAEGREERMTMQEFMDWTPPMGEPVGEADPAPSSGEREPEPEGEEGSYTRKCLACDEPTPLPWCIDCWATRDAAPDAPQEDRELRDTYTNAGLAEACDMAATVVHHHPDKNYAHVLAHQLEKAADRLRGAPEGAGELLHEAAEIADWAVDLIEMYDEKLLDMGEPEEKVRSETHLAGLRKARRVRDRLYEASRLRTGREGRDDG